MPGRYRGKPCRALPVHRIADLFTADAEPGATRRKATHCRCGDVDRVALPPLSTALAGYALPSLNSTLARASLLCGSPGLRRVSMDCRRNGRQWNAFLCSPQRFARIRHASPRLRKSLLCCADAMPSHALLCYTLPMPCAIELGRAPALVRAAKHFRGGDSQRKVLHLRRIVPQSLSIPTLSIGSLLEAHARACGALRNLSAAEHHFAVPFLRCAHLSFATQNRFLGLRSCSMPPLGQGFHCKSTPRLRRGWL